MRVSILAIGLLAASPVHAGCNPTMVELVDWSIAVVDSETNRLATTVRSNAEKPIRMIDASVVFRDASGGLIASYAMELDGLLTPGGEFKEENLWGPKTFERLLVLEPDEVRTEVCVRSVLYDDGTQDAF